MNSNYAIQLTLRLQEHTYHLDQCDPKLTQLKVEHRRYGTTVPGGIVGSGQVYPDIDFKSTKSSPGKSADFSEIDRKDGRNQQSTGAEETMRNKDDKVGSSATPLATPCGTDRRRRGKQTGHALGRAWPSTTEIKDRVDYLFCLDRKRQAEKRVELYKPEREPGKQERNKKEQRERQQRKKTGRKL
ncbi:hypothetical protein NDU88_002170 [Pleurodeles waltl]|uniref:Uncharacterized protein n=1 Tax=Pleurodeles waltl TaxID=8319 RepID=A0AAV7LZR4_PLEWA|nr:hypothetical protein NDU88_002170 [Pleurodeles waltl]